jgi:hypothetical protein
MWYKRSSNVQLEAHHNADTQHTCITTPDIYLTQYAYHFPHRHTDSILVEIAGRHIQRYDKQG